MKYMGSKNRIAKEILPIILKDRKPNQCYVEPFVGGGNLIDKVEGFRIGADLNPFVIEALKLIRDNPESLPDHVSEEYYQELKTNKELNGLTGVVGFTMSFAGKWFAGFARDKIESGSVDLILTDLPYGTVKNAKFYDYCGGAQWDVVIDTKKIMQLANRILRRNGKMVLFAQQPFSNDLMNNALPNLPYSYTIIWEKDNFANPLISAKAPVNYYEDILIFSKGNHGDSGEDNTYREYLNEERKKANLTLDQMCGVCELNTKGHGGAAYHWCSSKQPQLIPEKHYLTLRNKTGYFKKEYNELKEIHKKSFQKDISVFNLWEDKKYKSNILKYKKDYTGHHPTQKPVLLLEDLIKTFSNVNDIVVDLTMGSGSTGVACVNTIRKFIGIEMDENYFNIATKRIEEAQELNELL